MKRHFNNLATEENLMESKNPDTPLINGISTPELHERFKREGAQYGLCFSEMFRVAMVRYQEDLPGYVHSIRGYTCFTISITAPLLLLLKQWTTAFYYENRTNCIRGIMMYWFNVHRNAVKPVMPVVLAEIRDSSIIYFKDGSHIHLKQQQRGNLDGLSVENHVP